MRSAAPLYWYQGLFLQPHHFQQLEQNLWGSLLPRFAMLQPFFWGVRGLEFRESSLVDQVLEITQGEFLFKDGTLASLPGNAQLASRSFKKTWTETDRPLKAFVGIRRWQERPNVTLVDTASEPGEIPTRFLCPVDPREVKDLHQEGPDASLRLLTHALRIFWEDELPGLGDYELLPVAVVENSRGALRLSSVYTPPAVQVSDSDALTQILREIRDQALSFSRNLEEYKGAQEGGDGQAGVATYLAALRMLGRYVPQLQHLATNPGIHPWDLHVLLRQFAGELSCFSTRVNVLGRLPDGRSLVGDYSHEDSLPGFIELQTLIVELLGSLLVGPLRIIDLIREGAMFLATLPPEVVDSACELYLSLRTTAPAKTQLAESLVRIAKLGSQERVPALVARALSGVRLERRTVTPPGLPKHPDAIHFWIDQRDPQWQEIKRTQSFCFYWDQAPEDTTAEIVVLQK
jgi:type VI secretion system protein ImpJ